MKYVRKCNSLSEQQIRESALLELSLLSKLKRSYSEIHYNGELIGYRFFIERIIFDVNIDFIKQIPNFIKLYEPFINNPRLNKIIINTTDYEKGQKSFFISPLERFKFNGKYIRSYELKNIEQLKYIIRLSQTDVELNIKYLSLLSKENSTSLDDVQENSTSLNDSKENSTSPEIEKEEPRENSTSPEVITEYIFQKDKRFNTGLPLDEDDVQNFLIMMFNRINFYIGNGKSKKDSYYEVLKEMNELGSNFNELLEKVTKIRNANARRKNRNKNVKPFSVHIIKDYYTKRYILKEGKIYRR